MMGKYKFGQSIFIIVGMVVVACAGTRFCDEWGRCNGGSLPRRSGIDWSPGTQDDSIQKRNCPSYCSGLGWCDAEGVCQVEDAKQRPTQPRRTGWIAPTSPPTRKGWASPSLQPRRKQLWTTKFRASTTSPPKKWTRVSSTRKTTSVPWRQKTTPVPWTPVPPNKPSYGPPTPNYKNDPDICKRPDFRCYAFDPPPATMFCKNLKSCQVCNWRGQCIKTKKEELEEFCDECKMLKNGWCNVKRQCVVYNKRVKQDE